MELQSNKFHIESAIKIIRRRIINFANSFFAAIVIWNIYEREDIFLIDSSHCPFFMLLLLGNIFNLNSDCHLDVGFIFFFFFQETISHNHSLKEKHNSNISHKKR
jgi:hypothetical protein